MGLLLLFKNKQIPVQAGILDLFSLSQGGIAATSFRDEASVEIAEIVVESLNPTSIQSVGPGIVDIFSLTQGGWAVPSNDHVAEANVADVFVSSLLPTAIITQASAQTGGSGLVLFYPETYVFPKEDHVAFAGTAEISIETLAAISHVSENIVANAQAGGSKIYTYSPRSTVTQNMIACVPCYRFGIFAESITAKQDYYSLSEEEIILLLAA